MKNQIPIIGLFSKYLDGQCSPQDVKLLQTYFNNPENEEILRSLIRAELEKEMVVTNADLNEDVISKVRAQLISIINVDNYKGKPRFIISRWIKAAALWFLLLGTAIFLINRYLVEIKALFNPVKNITLFTRPGERKYIVLSDGSKIWLSPSSSLCYPDQFIGNLREVRLEGEAFFQIAKDKKHPFIIHTDKMSTRVVGTSFEIDAYQKQQQYTVTVVTGIVRVSLQGVNGTINREVVLRPFQRVIYTKNKDRLSASEFPLATQTLSKKSGAINSRNMTVSELINKLSEYYNIPILLSDIPVNRVCYGDFDTNKPLAILLKQIALSLNGNVSFHHNGYIISGESEKNE